MNKHNDNQQVLCVAPLTATGVTSGKVYGVLSRTSKMVEIFNNNSNICRYPKRWFKEVNYE